MVKKVIPQHTLDYRPNLRKIRPDFVVHGNDWRKGILKKTRLQVVMQEYRVFFPAFLKILRPSEQFLKWFPLGGQYFVIAKKY